jgi:AcrR family transcriptional regulator
MSHPRVAGVVDSAQACPQETEARQRIKRAAFHLFGARGYSCTSIQDIADAAEVQKSILYYYFGSKEGLYQTLYSESAKSLQTFLLQALHDVGLPSEGLENGWRVEPPATISCETLLSTLAETLISLARDNREPVRFFMAHIFAPDGDRPPVSTDEMEHITPHLIQHIALCGMRRGELSGDLGALDRLLLGALQYSIIRHLRNPEQEPLTAGLGQSIVRALLHGFSPREQLAKTPQRRTRPGVSRMSARMGK